MKNLTFAVLGTLAVLIFGNPVSAGMRDSYLESAEKLRDAASEETDPYLRQQYLDQAERMERNAKALESDAPVFRGDSIQDTLNQQLRALEEQRQQMQSRQRNSSRGSCGAPVCAYVAPK